MRSFSSLPDFGIPRRIAVVGTMGSGKTTIGRAISGKLGVDHVELDQFFWQADWKPCPTETMRELVSQALAGNAWVADGNHEDVRDLMWGRADTVVWLDYPVSVVLWRLAKRTVRRMGSREELWNGNRERIGNVLSRDDLLLWVFRQHREKQTAYPKLLARPEYRHLRLVRLRSPRRARRWIADLPRIHEPAHLQLVPRPAAGDATIVHVADYGGPYSGNFIASLRALDGALIAQGARQVLVLPKRALQRDWFADLGQTTNRIYVLNEDQGFVRTSLQLWRIVIAERASIVHVHFGRWDLPSWIASALARATGVRAPVIWHEHGGSLPEAPSLARRLKDLVKLRLMGRWTNAVAVSTVLRDDLVARGFHKKHAHFVPNRIDLARATATTAPRADLRRRLDLADDAVVFLTFGWAPHRKGVDVALSAMEQVTTGLPHARLLLVGGPPLEEFVRNLIGERFPEWLRLASPSESVGDFYGAADVFLAPSREEGMPYSVAEAMANRLPVIASDIGGHRWFEPASGVKLFPDGSVSALAEAIDDVASWSPESRAGAAAANADFAAERFSLESWTDDILAIYRKLLPKAMLRE